MGHILVCVLLVTVHSILGRAGTQTRLNRVQSSCWRFHNSKEATIAAALRSGIVKEVCFRRQPEKKFLCEENQIVDVSEADDSQFASVNSTNDGKLITCSQGGKVVIYELSNNKYSPMDDFEVNGPVETMKHCIGTSIFGVGGNENDLNTWDITTKQCVFKARNVPHDKLEMRVPVWISDLTFLKKSQDKSDENENVIATCTGFKQVRIYDVRAQRRPVQDKEMSLWGHLTAIRSVDEHTVLIADVQGRLGKFDIRTMRLCGKFKGHSGGIRSLDIHPSEPLVASCGLDRIVRVHSLKTRKLYGELYVKQRLTTIHFCPDFDETIKPAILNEKKRKNSDEDSRSQKALRSDANEEDEVVDISISDESDESEMSNGSDDDENSDSDEED